MADISLETVTGKLNRIGYDAFIQALRQAKGAGNRHLEFSHWLGHILRVQGSDVALERMPGELRLRIEDDGRGIPPRVRSGIGLTSIRDRARELGGSTTIGSSPDGGASIAVRLPFVEPRPRTAEVPV